MIIMYRSGKEMLLADALSHLPSRTDTEIQLNLRVNAISMSAFTRSWPDEDCSRNTMIQSFQQYTDWHWMVGQTDTQTSPESPETTEISEMMLSIEGNLLMKGECVIIPPSCRYSIMDDLRTSHEGINKALTLARTCAYWSWYGSRCNRLYQEMPDMHLTAVISP